ncbi:MAG: glycoside hydrolase family 13 protein [Armatimonadota bacterium]
MNNKYIYLSPILSLFLMFFPLSIGVVQADTDENLWYENAVWYQIFPDRFYRIDTGEDKVITDIYDVDGDPVYIELTSWDNDKPTLNSKYGGNFKGIMEKIPYLKSLGINAVWLNPVFASTSSHRYNTSDYAKIDPLLGTEEEFKELINKLHENGIKIILDGVFNHTGYEFWAFQDIIKNGEASKYKDWYNVKSYPVIKIWEQSEDFPPNYECWWGLGGLPKINFKCPEVKEYIYDITKKWMDLGIDGWRLDVADEINDDEFWIKWCALVKKCNPDALIVGEIWGDASPWLNEGNKFDTVMNYYGFRAPVLKFFCSERISVSEFDKILKARRNLYDHKANYAMLNIMESHDTARISSSVYNKDHVDQAKNSADYYNGAVDKEAYKKLKPVYLFQFTYVGNPVIYYGGEIGMYGGTDPHCRKPFIWDKASQNTELLEWIKKLASIRKENPALRTGTFATLLCDDGNKVYSYMRETEDDKNIIAINYSPDAAEVNIPLQDKLLNGEIIDLVSGEKVNIKNQVLTLKLDPYSGIILKSGGK